MLKVIKTLARRANHADGAYFDICSDSISFTRKRADEYSSACACASLIKIDMTSGDKYLKVVFKVKSNYYYPSNKFTFGFDSILNGTLNDDSFDVFKRSGDIADSQRFSCEVNSSSCRNYVFYIPINENVEFIKLLYISSDYYDKSIREEVLDFESINYSVVMLDNDEIEKVLLSYDISHLSIISPELKWHGRGIDNDVKVIFSSVHVPYWKYQLNHIFNMYSSNVLYLNDSKSLWYQYGIGTISPSKMDLIALIKKFTRNSCYSSSTFVGLSMGGFGAIEFGKYCLADKVIAFNPDYKLMEPNSRSKGIITGVNIQELSIRDLLPSSGQVMLYFSRYDDYDVSNYNKVQELYRGNVDLGMIESGHMVGELFEDVKFVSKFLNK